MQVPSSIKNLNTMANETAMRSLSTHDKKISDFHKYSGMQIPEWVCKYTH